MAIKNARLDPLPDSFLELPDVPDSYAGQAGKAAVVNLLETGLGFQAGVGGQNPLFASAMIPGAVTQAVEPPHVPAFYGGTATEIYAIRKGTATSVQFTIYHYNQAGALQNSQAVNMVAARYKSQAINWTVAENDYFYIDVTTVAGSPTDLVWQVRP